MTDLGSIANLESYKALIDKFNKLDIVTKELTLFDVGARGHFENPTIELLSFFLKSNRLHELENCFFNGLQKVIAGRDICSSLGSLESVETEVSTAKGNRIDLLLETTEALIIVECKIYHQQNNPFDDYASYCELRRQSTGQSKKLVKLVLCLDGRTDDVIKNNGWHGISYKELVADIEPHLSKSLLVNPYNKWGLFARDFLLHLKGLNSMGEISKDEVNFLNDNFKEFTKLSAYIYEELMPKIGKKIATDLNSSGLQNFVCKEKYGKWNYYEPIRRFSNVNWTIQSDILLCVRAYDKTVSHHINLHIGDQSEKLVEDFKNLLSIYFPNNFARTWYELSNTFWGISWEFNDFEIEEVSRNIVKLMRCLNELELNCRPFISE